MYEGTSCEPDRTRAFGFRPVVPKFAIPLDEAESMPITVECECGKEFRAPDQSAGKKVRCPACSSVRDVPLFPSAPPAAPPPPRPAPPPPVAQPLRSDPVVGPVRKPVEPVQAPRPGKPPAKTPPPAQEEVLDLDDDEPPRRPTSRPPRSRKDDSPDRAGGRTPLLAKLLIVVGLLGMLASAGMILYLTFVPDSSGPGTEEPAKDQ